ncbi:hypothetical protein [Rhizobium bangladeshense]|uniref:hypothetical protein n=1 Tax=Rhizobium bangladeshense TaxID=1138189 RepID=UPI0007E579A2|nr:hypothetical protein [Rhizobium bangladeshense]
MWKKSKNDHARRVTAKSGCDEVASATAELGKEGPRGRRMVRDAVQDERRSTIGVTTLQRVEGAVRQLEGAVFELPVCQASTTFMIARGKEAGAGLSEGPPAAAAE